MDDNVAGQLRCRTAQGSRLRSGKPFRTVVNEALRSGVENNRIADVTGPYRLKPVPMGEMAGPHDLDKALQLADHLEDEEVTRKLHLLPRRVPPAT